MPGKPTRKRLVNIGHGGETKFRFVSSNILALEKQESKTVWASCQKKQETSGPKYMVTNPGTSFALVQAVETKFVVFNSPCIDKKLALKS